MVATQSHHIITQEFYNSDAGAFLKSLFELRNYGITVTPHLTFHRITVTPHLTFHRIVHLQTRRLPQRFIHAVLPAFAGCFEFLDHITIQAQGNLLEWRLLLHQ
jgi:hypothetical protein